MHPRRRLKKNEGSMVQTCRNINVHVINTCRYVLKPT